MSRRADVLAGDSGEVLPLIGANPDFKRILLEPSIAKGYVAFGLSREMSTADLATFNIYIRQQKDAGVIDQMLDEAIKEVIAAAQ